MNAIMVAVLAIPALAGEPLTYGNPAGCGQDADTAIRLLPTELEYWEETCALPKTVDFSGSPMTLDCSWGDTADHWSRVISLTKEGSVIVHEENGVRTELRRCPTP